MEEIRWNGVTREGSHRRFGVKKKQPGIKTNNEILQSAIDEYRHKNGDKPFRMKDVARWGFRTGKLSPRPADAIDLMARDLARAAREQYFEDPQGRRVRKKHARRESVIIDGEEKQMVIWDDILTAKPEHMRVAFQQRRLGILWDCKHHKTDVDSYNDNNEHGATLQFEYDFKPDMVEMDQPTEYSDEKPYDEEDDEDTDDGAAV
jgi:hypothetical protein